MTVSPAFRRIESSSESVKYTSALPEVRVNADWVSLSVVIIPEVPLMLVTIVDVLISSNSSSPKGAETLKNNSPSESTTSSFFPSFFTTHSDVSSSLTAFVSSRSMNA